MSKRSRTRTMGGLTQSSMDAGMANASTSRRAARSATKRFSKSRAPAGVSVHDPSSPKKRAAWVVGRTRSHPRRGGAKKSCTTRDWTPILNPSGGVGETVARRQSRSWNRTDSLLVLASYLDRPGRMAVPPRQERERVAGVIGHHVDEVSRRCWMFAGLDPDNAADGEPAGERELKLWNQYASDRMKCMLDADDALAAFKRVPHHLS